MQIKKKKKKREKDRERENITYKLHIYNRELQILLLLQTNLCDNILKSNTK